MSDLFDDPLVLQLLRDADNAQRLLQRPGTPGREDLQLAIDSIHADLGRVVYARFLARHDPTMAIEDQVTLGDPLEPPDDDGPSPWDAPTEAIPAAELRRRVEEMAQQAEADTGPITLDDLEPLDEDDAPWRETLDQMMALLPSDGASVELQTTQLQWATVGCVEQLRQLPEPVATSVIGMLAANARQLQEVLSLSVGPARALARLRVMRPDLSVLDPQAGPERGSWQADARHWRSTLEGAA